MLRPLIAIDGPAGSGKSTVARAVAARLGLDYLDTGAMYRAVAFEALRRGVAPGDAQAVAELAREMELVVADRVVVNGTDATTEIRSPEVTGAVSTVAAIPAVRQVMVGRQRGWAEAREGGVVEGRDIGTVVFPEAPVKVFLIADDAVRAGRRSKETAAADVDQVAADLARRDHLDSTRAISPLAAAGDAIRLDTTEMTAEEVVERVLDLVAKVSQ